MRDIYEVIERLAETTAAVLELPPAARYGEYRFRAHEAGEAWDEYLGVMMELEPSERVLADPTWPDRMEAAVQLHAERMEFYRQQTGNIRAAWAAMENA